MTEYLPEGRIFKARKTPFPASDEAILQAAIARRTLFEAPAIRFDRQKNLLISLDDRVGVIPFSLSGIVRARDAHERLIASLVGRPVCFYLHSLAGETVTLSRKDAQEDCQRDYIDKLTSGDVIPATVRHIKPFGAFCDIGRGITALLPVGAVSFSRIAHPNQLLCEGDELFCVVKSTADNKILLSHKELLGSFEENAKEFEPGETVTGVVRSITDYGIFVELTPNLTGLAEPADDIEVGDSVGVYIKSILPQKLKVKLAIIGKAQPATRRRFSYRITGGHINEFRYSPRACDKEIGCFF